MDILQAALVVNLFWFSLPLIGYATVLFLSRQNWWRYGQKLAQILLKQHIFTVAVASFAIVVGLFSFVSFPLYIFHLPVVIPAVIYLILFLSSLAYLVVMGTRHLFIVKSPDIFGLNGQTLFVKLLFFVLCLLLVADLAITIFLVPAFPWGDGIFHMARVVNILGEGFNIQSSFFHTLPEGGYLYNVVYVLYSVPAFLSGIEPIRIWEYSLGFFRFMLWLSIFTLGVQVFKYWLKESKHWMLFSIIGLIAAISVYSAQFFTANYPSKMVIIWMILLFICLALSKREQIKLAAPVIVALSFLIATTHTTYALITGCFMAGLVVIRLIVMRKAYITKWTLIPQIISVLILLTGPLIAKLMPVRASEDLIEVAKIDTTSVFNMTMLTLKFPPDLWGWLIVIASFAAMTVVFVLLWKRKLVFPATLFAFAILLYPIIVYVPPIFTVFTMLMPTWVVQRFSSINVFTFLSVAFIAYVVYKLLVRFAHLISREKLNAGIVSNTTILIVVIAVAVFGAFSAKESYALLMEDRKEKQTAYNDFNAIAKSFKGILKDNDIVVSSPTHSYYLDALYDIDILATEYGHSPLAADGSNRDLCRIEVLNNLQYSDLKAIGTDYVLLSPYEDMAHTKALADKANYLKVVAKNQYYVVYEFLGEKMPANPSRVYKPCVDYQVNESN